MTRPTIRRTPLAAALLVAASATAMPTSAITEEARPELSPMARVPAMRAEFNKANEGAGDRVFGGNQADAGEWPFQVALLAAQALDESPASQGNAQFCGGSLIAAQWVLTAAHCVVTETGPVEPDSMVVLTEATRLDEGKRHNVEAIFPHEDYSMFTLDNDIALIKLAEPATAPTVRLVDAPGEDKGKVRVTGWGRMEDGNFPMNLMEAELELEPNSACNEGIKAIYAHDLELILRNFAPRMLYTETAITDATRSIVGTIGEKLTGNMICAGTTSGARDACNGDSGGPLFAETADGPLQVGIVSWGEGPMDASAACGHANAYGVYTRVANYKDWMKSKMGM